MTDRWFDEHARATLEAAMARIMPSDRDPGAREAGTIDFLDRYLAGPARVYANPAEQGFLELTGRRAAAWRARIEALRDLYRRGVGELDHRASELAGCDFCQLAEGEQDHVLAELELDELGPIDGCKPVMQRTTADTGLGFFATLVLHTRQGFYADPAYGGNRAGVGWALVGFPGPAPASGIAWQELLRPIEPWKI